ncbi:MAG TPA: DUF1844 domain-containing protein [Armatimonadota bacterium]|nr:DUF1844 domain-containing protein [Armatimonadota bacterium]
MADGADKAREPKEKEEEEVEVIDRRTSKGRSKKAPPPPPASEEPPAAPPDAGVAPDGAAESGAEEPKLDAQTLEALFPRSVYDVIASPIPLLAELAWIKIGLRAHPATGELDVDLAEAQVAIDTLDFILGKLEPKLSPEQQRELRTLIMNLKLNYASRANPDSGNN